jgi:phosphoglycerate-specific signal transduction histidine kinase
MKNFKKDEVIRKVIDMRIKDCASTRTIIDYLKDELGYETTQAYQYLRWAKEEIKEQFNQTNPEAINEAIAQYEEMLELIKKEKNYKLWNDMNKELNKLKGLYETKINLSGEVKTIQINYINPNETN